MTWRALGNTIEARATWRIADRFGLSQAISSIAGVTFVSGTIVTKLIQKRNGVLLI